jgi:hypothetical protein
MSTAWIWAGAFEMSPLHSTDDEFGPTPAPGRVKRALLNPQRSAILQLLPPYAIGSAAMFWVIQSIAAF